jgi:hypothetical protein
MRRMLLAGGFVMIGLFPAARPASALCGTDGQGPCYRYWESEAVFVAKVLDMVTIQPPDRLEPPPGMVWIGGNYRLQVRIAEAFRGVSAGTVMTLFAPGGVCGGVDAANGGELFIYATRNKAGELWAQGCGMSRPLELASADLAYARSVTSQGPSGVVFGDVFQRTDSYGRDFSPMSGVRVRVSSGTFYAEVATDDEGNYSIIVPHAGPFIVEVLKTKGFAAWRDRSQEAVTLPDARGCFRVNFQLKPQARN